MRRRLDPAEVPIISSAYPRLRHSIASAHSAMDAFSLRLKHVIMSLDGRYVAFVMQMPMPGQLYVSCVLQNAAQLMNRANNPTMKTCGVVACKRVLEQQYPHRLFTTRDALLFLTNAAERMQLATPGILTEDLKLTPEVTRTKFARSITVSDFPDHTTLTFSRARRTYYGEADCGTVAARPEDAMPATPPRLRRERGVSELDQERRQARDAATQMAHLTTDLRQAAAGVTAERESRAVRRKLDLRRP